TRVAPTRDGSVNARPPTSPFWVGNRAGTRLGSVTGTVRGGPRPRREPGSTGGPPVGLVGCADVPRHDPGRPPGGRRRRRPAVGRARRSGRAPAARSRLPGRARRHAGAGRR